MVTVTMVNEFKPLPPLHRWYHGKIDRDLASKRLHAIDRPGAYLVRNSESTPGSYVLTFLDRERRAFNYMIKYKDGQYNASGQSKRWFTSLHHLIGYYNKFSTVKQNQHLEVPVAPPEVCTPPPPPPTHTHTVTLTHDYGDYNTSIGCYINIDLLVCSSYM